MNSNRSEYAILGMLSLKPMSGYDIRKNVQQSIAHFWNESYGQIYPTLRRLAARSLVERHAGEGNRRSRRQVYALTKKGRLHLRGWLAEAPQQRPFRNELLLKLFFGRHAPPLAPPSIFRWNIAVTRT
jgi:PadR family transcriptional regulator, regulatory protein AphA